MQCDMSLKSEFGDGCEELCGVDDYTWGASNFEQQQAWVFVDRIVYTHNVFSWIIKTIIGVTVHELIHLCGYKDDDIAKRGEELLVWGGCGLCYRPLHPYQGK